mgnify:CR=1 FL=1
MFSVLSRKFLLSAFIISFLTLSLAAAEGETFIFKVRRAPIAKALFEFSKQSGVSVSRPRLSYRDGKTRFVGGTYSLEEALQRMLYGTDFTYEMVSAHSVRIMRKPKVRMDVRDVSHSIESDFVPVQEILVSSLRRVDRLQSVPYSISSVSGRQQEHLRARNTGDIAHRVSSVYVSKQGVGKEKITIRGLSDGAFAGRAQSVVSTYLDHTRLTYNAPDPGLKLIDMDRVEVLRGPQGTLYGSGALSGLYRVVNREPSTADIEVLATASYAWTKHGDPTKEISSVVNVPLAEDSLAFRMVAYADEAGGYIDDDRLGINNVNKSDTIGGRAALKYEPSYDWKFIVGGNFQEYDADDTNYYNGKLRRFMRNNYVREPYNDKFRQLYFTVNADLGWANLTTNASWMQRDIHKVWDGSLAVPKLVGLDVVPSPFTEKRDIKTFTSETHLSSKSGDRLEWLIGSFYSNRDDVMSSALIVPGAAEHPLLGGTDEIYSEDLVDDLKEIAFFGELTYYFSEQISMTTGLRWFDYNDKAASTITDIGFGVEQTINGRQKKSGITPKFVLSYHMNDTTLLYGQISQGYRVGGTNLLGPNEFDLVAAEAGEAISARVAPDMLGNYNSDKLINIEVGYKKQAIGGDLTVNAAAFYADWTDIQSLEYDFLGLPNVNNVGSARIFGAELDFLYRPSSRFEIQGNISFNDSEITDSTYLFGANIGDPLPGTPRVSAGLSGRYEFELTNDVSAAISTDYVYVGGSNLLFDRQTSPQMDPYHLSNVRFSLYRGAWQITAFVNNILDSKANSFAFGNPFSLDDPFFQSGTLEPTFPVEPVVVEPVAHSEQFTPLRPRTVGLEISWHF